MNKIHYAGQRLKVNIKAVTKECILDKNWKRYYHCTDMDKSRRLSYLEAFQTVDTYSLALYIEHASAWFVRR